MTATVLAIVLAAAFLHAFWNALVKGAGDKSVTLALIALGHVPVGVILVSVSGPLPPSAVPYVVASTVIHWFYYVWLNTAYRFGDLSVVYPVARGLAPVMVALGALMIVGEALSVPVWIGITLISLGIMTLAAGVFTGRASTTAILAAVGVSLTIAAYSLVDGIGVRLSGDPAAYIGWLFIAEILVTLWICATRWPRVAALPRRSLLLGLVGGAVSGSAYGLVLYAKTLAPLGIVSALRETSVIFAAMIGVWWFREGPVTPRIIAAVVVGAGIVLIAI